MIAVGGNGTVLRNDGFGWIRLSAHASAASAAFLAVGVTAHATYAATPSNTQILTRP